MDFSTKMTRREAIAMLLDTLKYQLKMESNLHTWKCSLAEKIYLFPGNKWSRYLHHWYSSAHFVVFFLIYHMLVVIHFVFSHL